MPAIDIEGVSFSGSDIVLTVVAQNDVDQEAELAGSVGGTGFTSNFGPEPVPRNTTNEYTVEVPASSSVVGKELLVTASLTEPGVNTGNYPSVDEQRYVTIRSGGNVDIGGPEFGGGGEVGGGNGGSGPLEKIKENPTPYVGGLAVVAGVLYATNRGSGRGASRRSSR
jgi:hypothetical protein